jgi:hypothetical protein
MDQSINYKSKIDFLISDNTSSVNITQNTPKSKSKYKKCNECNDIKTISTKFIKFVIYVMKRTKLLYQVEIKLLMIL